MEGTRGVIDVSVVGVQIYGPGTSGSIFRADTTMVYITAFAHGRIKAIYPPKGWTSWADATDGVETKTKTNAIIIPLRRKSFILHIILYI